MSTQFDRLQPIPPQKQNAAQKEAHESLEKAMTADFGRNCNDVFSIHDAEGAFTGPLAPCINYPQLAKPHLELLTAVGQIAKLPTEVREINILAVGSAYRAAYELYAHERDTLATTSYKPEQVESMRKGVKLEGLNAQNSLTWDIARYLVQKPGSLPQGLWDKGVEVLGKDALVAVVVNTGVYSFTSILLNATNASVPSS